MNPPQVTDDLQTSLRTAWEDARRRKHEFLTLEHVLLALLDNDGVQLLLAQLEVDPDQIRHELELHLEHAVEVLPDDSQQPPQ